MIITKAGAKRALSKRLKERTEAPKFVIEDFLFAEQLAFVRDPSPNKVAMCSRRSGKTISCAADLIDTALNFPGTVSLYITLSRNNAKKIIWKELKKINKTYLLSAHESISELSFTFPNGSTIYLSGAKDVNEIEKFRGLALKLVYIDEAQSFRSYIEELVDDALGPTLMDHNGTICLIGTPPPVPNGYFIEAFTKLDSDWSRHSWTFFNNPFLNKTSGLTHDEMLEIQLKRRGVTREDPSIQREFFGRCVEDTDSLLLKYSALQNGFENLPKLQNPLDKYHYILGIDIGFHDADALAVIAWHESTPNIYLVQEIVTKQQDITSLVEQIESLKKHYDFDKMVIDSGGLGKKIAEELIKRYKIPVEAADKVRKMENIALLNDYLRTGRFKAKISSMFSEDSKKVEIDRDKSTPDKIKVSDRYHSDIIDAVLYAFKESYAYAYEAGKKRSPKGTKSWAQEEQDLMWEAAQEHFAKQSEDEDPFKNW